MRGFVLILLFGVVWMGCSQTVEMVVVGEAEMNGGGNAAVVHVYQLSGDGNFRQTPLSVFWRDDAAVLGGELVASPRTLTVYPSDSKTVEIEVADEAAYLGVAANLRDPDRERWRSIHRLEDVGDQIRVRIANDHVAVEVEDRTLPNVGLGLGR